MFEDGRQGQRGKGRLLGPILGVGILLLGFQVGVLSWKWHQEIRMVEAEYEAARALLEQRSALIEEEARASRRKLDDASILLTDVRQARDALISENILLQVLIDHLEANRRVPALQTTAGWASPSTRKEISGALADQRGRLELMLEEQLSWIDGPVPETRESREPDLATPPNRDQSSTLDAPEPRLIPTADLESSIESTRDPAPVSEPAALR